MLHYNFYTNRYWMSFFEMITAKLFGSTGATTGYVFLSHSYSSLISSFTPSLGSGTSTLYAVIDSGTKSVKRVAGQVVSNSYAEDVYALIKDRYMNEYVFDLSFDFTKYWNYPLWERPSDDYSILSWPDKEKEEYRIASSQWVIKFFNVMEQTYDRYALILKTYEDNKADLLNKVEAITRFNDTPQDSGEFADDSHTTHITTSKNDYDTLMGRIEEIDRKYRDVMRDWAREFEPLFIHEESL